MIREGITKHEAVKRWVDGFNAIDEGIVEKLIMLEPDKWHEVTAPSIDDRVYLCSGPHGDCAGRITEAQGSQYMIELDEGGYVEADENGFDIERDSFLPMWGQLWSFGESIDDCWLEEMDGIRLMSECGFRIYESDDYGYFFGIDGCGYDFYIAHFEPLYDARGLQWHDPKTEKRGEVA